MSRNESSPLRRWLAAAMGPRQGAAPPPPAAVPPSLEALVEERTRELRRALEAAEAASGAKSQFLAHLGHEIRTPMNGVMGMAELLAATALDTTQRGYLDLMRRSAGSLIAMLDQLLDFARLEAGEVEFAPQPLALRVLLDDVVAGVYPQALNKKLLLECRLAPDLPETVLADAARLRQVVQSLLSNALKFTGVGEVVLAARRDAGGVLIEVADTGIGVPRDMQPRVFAPFVQADEGIARRYGGIGLGLAVAQTLVRAMGGRIELESDAGRGATFRVHLPLPVADGLSRQPPGEALRVALVSDAPSAQSALAERLAWLGHEGVATLSWRELAFAPEALVAARPDAVLCDEPLAGWPPNALHGDPLPWTAVLLQRQPAGGAGLPPGARRLQRPLTDADLARALQPAQGVLMPPGAPAPAASGRGRVLLVEDNEINQVVARSFLEHLGVEVDVAADGAAAFQALHESSYALVVMDCQMPGMDGYELTRRIRAGEAGVRAQRAPIIALTAHASAADRERCVAAGMNDYLTKPVNPEQLGATLDRWLTPAR